MAKFTATTVDALQTEIMRRANLALKKRNCKHCKRAA